MCVKNTEICRKEWSKMAKCLKKAIAKYKDKIEWGEHESRKKIKNTEKLCKGLDFVWN